MTKIKTGKRKMPVRLRDGSALLHVGILADAEFSGVIIRHQTFKSLGFQDGQWLEIECSNQDTAITRSLTCGDCYGYRGLRSNFIYLDPLSAHFLGVELCEVIRVKPALYAFDIP